MHRRVAPKWFLETGPDSVHAKVQRWWPWALGVGAGALFLYNRKPFEDARISTLTSIRKPVLKTLEQIEALEPQNIELSALELPPSQLFGPLAMSQQIDFICQAVNDDNELADEYITRLVIMLMDLSLDPPFLESLFVQSGGEAILGLCVQEFAESCRALRQATT